MPRPGLFTLRELSPHEMKSLATVSQLHYDGQPGNHPLIAKPTDHCATVPVPWLCNLVLLPCFLIYSFISYAGGWEAPTWRRSSGPTVPPPMKKLSHCTYEGANYASWGHSCVAHTCLFCNISRYYSHRHMIHWRNRFYKYLKVSSIEENVEKEPELECVG